MHNKSRRNIAVCFISVEISFCCMALDGADESISLLTSFSSTVKNKNALIVFLYFYYDFQISW